MKLLRKLSIIPILIFLTQCTFNSEIRTFNELSKEETGGAIQIVALDTSVYFTDDYLYTDSTLVIKGRKSKCGEESVFNGKLHFEDIAYIQTRETYFFPTIAYLGLNLFICASAVSLIDAPSQIEPVIKYASSGSSCPYIYSWDGNNFHLEGEGFGTALGKALEIESSLSLRNLKAEESKIQLRISNERPETHFINNIELYAFELNYYETLLSDNYNNFYTVKEIQDCFEALNIHGDIITDLLLEEDNIYWFSDLETAKSDYNFEDQLMVELNNIEIYDSVAMIITAINTEIFNVVFEYIQKLLGDDYVNFIKAIEVDPELISILKDALEKSSLKIDVWNGEEWQNIDLVYPQANFVNFRKLVKIPCLKSKSSNIKIRLRCLTDVWQIDAIDFSVKYNQLILGEELSAEEVESNTTIVPGSIDYDDDAYQKLLPGQHMSLRYIDPKPMNDKRIAYGLKIKGYLYEWLLDKDFGKTDLVFVENPKIELLKEILRDMDTILPIIYQRWGELKACYANDKLLNVQ